MLLTEIVIHLCIERKKLSTWSLPKIIFSSQYFLYFYEITFYDKSFQSPQFRKKISPQTFIPQMLFLHCNIEHSISKMSSCNLHFHPFQNYSSKPHFKFSSQYPRFPKPTFLPFIFPNLKAFALKFGKRRIISFEISFRAMSRFIKIEKAKERQTMILEIIIPAIKRDRIGLEKCGREKECPAKTMCTSGLYNRTLDI